MSDGFDFEGDSEADAEATCIRTDPMVTTRTAPTALEKSDLRARRFNPHQPKTLADTGLSPSYIEELCLKHLFQAGDL